MTQKTNPKPGRDDKCISGLPVDSAEDYPVSPSLLAQLANLDGAEPLSLAPPLPSPTTPPNLRSRSRVVQESVQTPRRRMSRGLRLTPKACDSMHKTSQSRARQMEDDEMEQGFSPGRMEEDGPSQTNVANADGHGQLGNSSPAYMSEFMASEEPTPTRLQLHPSELPTQTWQENLHPTHDFMDTSTWAADGYAASAGHYSNPTNSFPQPSMSLPQDWQVGVPFPHPHQHSVYPPHYFASNQAPQFVSQHGGFSNHYTAAQTRRPLISPQLGAHGQHSGLGHQYAAACGTMLPNNGLDSNAMATLSRPASAHSIQGSHQSGPSPATNFEAHLWPVSAITQGIAGDVSMHHMPLPQGSAGGPMMALIPPTPVDRKGKGKQQETDVPMHIPSSPDINNAISDTGSNFPDSSSSPSSTGALSKSNITYLDGLWPRIEQQIADASETTGLPSERISKLLGKRLGLNVRGSTLWNSYQSFFTDHMVQELERINANAEYASATSAQKPAIVSRAQAAFKAEYEKDEEWVDILTTWDALQVVSKGCKGQSYNTRESKFDAMNHQVNSYLQSQAVQNRFSYAFASCGSLRNDLRLTFMSSGPLSKGFLLHTSRAATDDEFMERMQAYVNYQAEEQQTRKAFGEDDINPFISSPSSRPSPSPGQLQASNSSAATTRSSSSSNSKDAAGTRTTSKEIDVCSVIRDMFRVGFMTAGGLLKPGQQMPWITMAQSLGEQKIQMREWPFRCPFAIEHGKNAKGVESLTTADRALLKEAFVHSHDPITFYKIEDSDAHLIHSKELKDRVPVIISAISISLPLRRRVLYSDNTRGVVLVQSNAFSSPNASPSKAAALDTATASDSESEDAGDNVPTTPLHAQTRSKTLKATAKNTVKVEGSVTTTKRGGLAESRKRAHSITMVSSESPSSPLTPDIAKRARFAQSDSSLEISEITPAPAIKPNQRKSVARKASATTAAAAVTEKPTKVVKSKRGGKAKAKYTSQEFVVGSEEEEGEDKKNKDEVATVPEKASRPRPRPKVRAGKPAEATGFSMSPLTPSVPSSLVKPDVTEGARKSTLQADLKKYGAPIFTLSLATSPPPANLNKAAMRQPPPHEDAFTKMGSNPLAMQSKPLQDSGPPPPPLLHAFHAAPIVPHLLTPSLKEPEAVLDRRRGAAPERHHNTTPEGEVAPDGLHQAAPEHHRKAASESGREAAAKNPREAAPESRRGAAPESHRGAAPEGRGDVAPGGRHEAAPEHRREAAPESGREAAPDSRREAVLTGRRGAAPESRRDTTPEARGNIAQGGRHEAAPDHRREVVFKGGREAAPEHRRETSSRPRLDSGPSQRQHAAMDDMAAESEGRSEDRSDEGRQRGRSRYSPYTESHRDHHHPRDNDRYESAVRDSDYVRRDFSREHTPHFPSQSDTGYYPRRSQSPEYGGRPSVYYQRQYRSPSPQAGPSRRSHQDAYYRRPPSPQAPRRPRQDTYYHPPSSQAGSSRGSSRRQYQDTQIRHSPYPDGGSGCKMDVEE